MLISHSEAQVHQHSTQPPCQAAMAALRPPCPIPAGLAALGVPGQDGAAAPDAGQGSGCPQSRARRASPGTARQRLPGASARSGPQQERGGSGAAPAQPRGCLQALSSTRAPSMPRTQRQSVARPRGAASGKGKS